MTSSNCYVYLEHPHTGIWITIGRYGQSDNAAGQFQYAKSYLGDPSSVAIDPINLPLLPGLIPATRYQGLHDVIRDACPDSWGRALIKREFGLTEGAPHLSYLMKAGNADQWGALAIGTSRQPSIAHLNNPKLPELEALVLELTAMSDRLPAINAKLRRKILSTPSLGGARPKATVQDHQIFWLAKPVLSSDVFDVPLLEHAMQQWASATGMNFAQTQYISFSDTKGTGLSVLLSSRFDRVQGRRRMVLSAASMLQAEYPNSTVEQTSRWSYPRLSDALAQIGVPRQDQIELFNRMVFNAVIGNDDDHPRNHAAIYVPEEQRWRLAPAFDVVPETAFMPQKLSMILGESSTTISRANILADALRFGFANMDQAQSHLDAFLHQLRVTYERIQPILTDRMNQLMLDRIDRTW